MKLSVSGEAQKHVGGCGGTYFLQEDKTNNKTCWIHKSGGKAIWWDKEVDKWNVGNFDKLGSEYAGIKGPSNNDNPPNQITNDWKYSTDPDDPWADAKINEILFEDWTFKQGKFFHSLCKIFLHAEYEQTTHFYDLIISQKEYNIIFLFFCN